MDFLKQFPSAEPTVSAAEVFRDLDEKYGKAGAVLKGARLRESFTQKELAEKIRIEQADLSKMENGKLSIGRERAKRLAQVLKSDYRTLPKLFKVARVRENAFEKRPSSETSCSLPTRDAARAFT